jgi:hypothetical protein
LTARWTAVTAPEPFPSDRYRVEYLFALYEKLTAPLVAASKPKKLRKLPRAVPSP